MTTLLIDAVHTLISCDAEGTFETRGLNQELADYLTTRSEPVIVVTNARGHKWAKIRELLADYTFEFHSMENVVPKTDPEYRAHVMMYYGLDPQECFLLDHKTENLEAADEIELQGELFIDNTQAIEVLESLENH